VTSMRRASAIMYFRTISTRLSNVVGNVYDIHSSELGCFSPFATVSWNGGCRLLIHNTSSINNKKINGDKRLEIAYILMKITLQEDFKMGII
jgi:hypothetical protein